MDCGRDGGAALAAVDISSQTSSANATPTATPAASEPGVGSSSGGTPGGQLAICSGGFDSCSSAQQELGQIADEQPDEIAAQEFAPEPDNGVGVILFENPNLQLPKFGEPYCTKCG